MTNEMVGLLQVVAADEHGAVAGAAVGAGVTVPDGARPAL